MRLLHLEMKGFESYAEKTQIEFSEMQGLWLITGPTGCGKTTIFDAVTYALFGESSGGERKGTGLRSGYSKSTDETYVKLVFEHQGRQWTVTRNPTYMRAKRSGSGLTQESAGVRLQCAQEPVIDKVDEVRKRISGMLGGINAEQFRQVAMIAQNKFEALLKANSAERSKLLSQLLKTGCFASLTGMLYELRGKADKETGDARILLQEAFKGFDWQQADLTIPQVASLVSMLAEKTSIGIEETSLQAMAAQLAANQAAIGDHEKLLEPLEVKVNSLRQDLGSAEQIHGRYLKLVETERLVSSGEQLMPQKKKEQQLQRRAQDAFAVQPAILSARRAVQSRVDAGNAVAQSRIRQQQAEAQLEEAKAAVNAVPELRKQLQAGQLALNTLQEQLKLASRAAEKTREVQKAQKTAEATESDIRRKNAEIQRHAEQREKLQPAADSLPQCVEALEKAQQALRQAQDRVKLLRDLKAQEEKDAADAAEQETREQEHLQKLQAHAAAGAEYTRVNEAYFSNLAGQVARQKLKEGFPCPVCGSMSHPAPCRLDAAAVDRQALDQALKDLNEASEAERKADQATAAIRVKREEHNRQIEYSRRELGITTQAAVALADALRTQEQATSSRRQAEALKLGAQQAVQSCTELQKQDQEALKQLEELRTRYIHEHAAEESLKKELQVLRASISGTEAELTEQIRCQENENTRLGDQIKALEERKSKADVRAASARATLGEKQQLAERCVTEERATAAALTEQLKRYDFIDAAEAEALMKTYGDLRGLNEQVHRLTEWFSAHAAAVKLLADIRGELEGRPDQDPELVRAELTGMETKVQEAREQLRVSKSRYERNEKAYQLTLQRYQKYREAVSHLTLCSNLYHKVSGKQGDGYRQSLALETFVQRIYFQQVIDYANTHLARMTDGTLSLYMKYGGVKQQDTQDEDSEKPGAQKKKDSTRDMIEPDGGLELFVLSSETGTHDASALSGGEAFKASLALALGLSTLVSSTVNNVDLGILFIDEGFGTLDEGSLNQAMDVLDGISQEQSRLVTIISHRPEMKQRIPNQIQVSRDGSGSHHKVIRI